MKNSPLLQIGTQQGRNFSLFEILDPKNRPPPNCVKLRFWAFQNILRLGFFENFPKSERFPLVLDRYSGLQQNWRPPPPACRSQICWILEIDGWYNPQTHSLASKITPLPPLRCLEGYRPWCWGMRPLYRRIWDLQAGGGARQFCCNLEYMYQTYC